MKACSHGIDSHDVTTLIGSVKIDGILVLGLTQLVTEIHFTARHPPAEPDGESRAALAAEKGLHVLVLAR